MKFTVRRGKASWIPSWKSWLLPEKEKPILKPGVTCEDMGGGVIIGAARFEPNPEPTFIPNPPPWWKLLWLKLLGKYNPDGYWYAKFKQIYGDQNKDERLNHIRELVERGDLVFADRPPESENIIREDGAAFYLVYSDGVSASDVTAIKELQVSDTTLVYLYLNKADFKVIDDAYGHTADILHDTGVHPDHLAVVWTDIPFGKIFMEIRETHKPENIHKKHPGIQKTCSAWGLEIINEVHINNVIGRES